MLLVALGLSAGTIWIGAVALACPPMMFVMMRTMMSGHSLDRNEHRKDPVDHPHRP